MSPYIPTGGKSGRPRLPEPLAPTTLQETITALSMECAARKPSQVRIRGLELLLTQFRDAAIEQAKEQAELDKTAIKELTEANTVLVEQVKAVSDELSNVNGQLSAERWKTKSIEGLQKRIDELKPLAERWQASQVINANGLGELAKQEATQREASEELSDVEARLARYDVEQAQPDWFKSFMQRTEAERDEYNITHIKVIRRHTELIETPEQKVLRLAKEERERREAAHIEEIKRENLREAIADDKRWKQGFSNSGRCRLRQDLQDIARCNRMHGGSAGVLSIDK